MSSISILLCACLAASPVFAAGSASPAAESKPKPKTSARSSMTEHEQVLYSLGVWLSEKIDVFHLSPSELRSVEAGLRDGVLGNKLKVDVAAVSPKINELAKERMGAAAAKEKEASKKVLADASAQPGAETLPSGVIFQTLKEGSGEAAKADDTVTFHLTGSVDGKVFEDTKELKKPAEATPDETGIPCLKEGLTMIKPGGSAKLTCPSSTAFGDTGHPPTIPGGAAVVLEVEVLDVKKGVSAEQEKDALEKAAKEPGAKKYPSGLVMRTTKQGKGPSPKASDTVKVNYKGTLVDGKVFDSNKGITFPLGSVIPCWTEGLQKMKIGGSAVLTCPASIAYGAHGMPPMIPPGATLTFQVDLLEIVKK